MNNKFRGCLKANYLDIEMLVKPNEIVNRLLSKDKITTADKEEIDNCFGLRQKNRKLLEILWNKGADCYAEFLHALRSNVTYKEIANQIENAYDSHNGDNELPNIEIEEDFNDKIPKARRDLHDQHVLNWRQDEDKFVETTAVKEIEKRLKENSCVLVVARPGNSKSAIVRHIAVKLQDEEGYDIIPIVLGPANILDYYNPSRRQVFTVDDICGKGTVNIQLLDVWALQIGNILNLFKKDIENESVDQYKKYGALKIIFTCELDVYEATPFRRLESLDTFVVKLSEWPLNDEEKLAIMRKYTRLDFDDKIQKKGLTSDQNTLSLLCKLAEGKPTAQVIKIFEEPKNFIRKEFELLKQNHNFQFRIITVCSLLGCFDVNMLNDDFSSSKDKDKFTNICMELNIDLYKESTKKRIKEQLENLTKTYFTDVGEIYYFKHEIILEIAAVTCGMEYTNLFITYSSSVFIGGRFVFRSFLRENEETKYESFILMNDEKEKRYFDRLILDLEEGIVSSTFHNKQLKFEKYVEMFRNYCETRKMKVKELLHRFEENKETDNIQGSEEGIESAVCKNDFEHKLFESKIPLIESVWEGVFDVVRMLLDMECNVHEADNLGRTALYVACLLGKKEIVQLLLDNGANCEVCDSDRRSPLHAASKEGYKDIVKLLLKNSPEMSMLDFNGSSPLFVACESGHKGVVDVLLDANADMSKCNNLGQSPLFIASLHGRKDVVELLLKKEAQVNETDKNGQSPLFAACMNGHFSVVKLLLERKADIMQCDNDKRSPLFIASEAGHLEIVKILLSTNLELTSKCDWHERSPLFVACSEDRVQIVDFLVSRSEINCCDEDGRSPLFIACEKGYLRIVEILINHNADVNKLDINDRTPLYVACRGGYIKIVEILNGRGANMSLCNKWGASPLFVACREGHLKVVKYLVEKGAEISKCDSNGETPLFVASEEGNLDIVEYLTSKGADLGQRDNEDRSPIQVAKIGDHKEVVQFLKEQTS